MNAWCDTSTIDGFLPNVTEQIEKLAAGNPRFASAAAGVRSTAFAESV
jgi:hypothetical protein